MAGSAMTGNVWLGALFAMTVTGITGLIYASEKRCKKSFGNVHAGIYQTGYFRAKSSRTIAENRTENRKSNLDYTIYEGKQLEGKIQIVIKSGQTVYKNGKLNAEKGSGKYLV